jgi:hypothetical protein
VSRRTKSADNRVPQITGCTESGSRDAGDVSFIDQHFRERGVVGEAEPFDGFLYAWKGVKSALTGPAVDARNRIQKSWRRR